MEPRARYGFQPMAELTGHQITSPACQTRDEWILSPCLQAVINWQPWHYSLMPFLLLRIMEQLGYQITFHLNLGFRLLLRRMAQNWWLWEEKYLPQVPSMSRRIQERHGYKLTRRLQIGPPLRHRQVVAIGWQLSRIQQALLAAQFILLRIVDMTGH